MASSIGSAAPLACHASIVDGIATYRCASSSRSNRRRSIGCAGRPHSSRSLVATPPSRKTLSASPRLDASDTARSNPHTRLRASACRSKTSNALRSRFLASSCCPSAHATRTRSREARAALSSSPCRRHGSRRTPQGVFGLVPGPQPHTPRCRERGVRRPRPEESLRPHRASPPPVTAPPPRRASRQIAKSSLGARG